MLRIVNLNTICKPQGKKWNAKEKNVEQKNTYQTVDLIINVKCPDQTCLYFERTVKKWELLLSGWVNFLGSKNNVDFTKMYFLK